MAANSARAAARRRTQGGTAAGLGIAAPAESLARDCHDWRSGRIRSRSDGAVRGFAPGAAAARPAIQDSMNSNLSLGLWGLTAFFSVGVAIYAYAVLPLGGSPGPQVLANAF